MWSNSTPDGDQLFMFHSSCKVTKTYDCRSENTLNKSWALLVGVLVLCTIIKNLNFQHKWMNSTKMRSVFLRRLRQRCELRRTVRKYKTWDSTCTLDSKSGASNCDMMTQMTCLCSFYVRKSNINYSKYSKLSASTWQVSVECYPVCECRLEMA